MDGVLWMDRHKPFHKHERWMKMMVRNNIPASGSGSGMDLVVQRTFSLQLEWRFGQCRLRSGCAIGVWCAVAQKDEVSKRYMRVTEGQPASPALAPVAINWLSPFSIFASPAPASYDHCILFSQSQQINRYGFACLPGKSKISDYDIKHYSQ